MYIGYKCLNKIIIIIKIFFYLRLNNFVLKILKFYNNLLFYEFFIIYSYSCQISVLIVFQASNQTTRKFLFLEILKIFLCNRQRKKMELKLIFKITSNIQLKYMILETISNVLITCSQILSVWLNTPCCIHIVQFLLVHSSLLINIKYSVITSDVQFFMMKNIKISSR